MMRKVYVILCISFSLIAMEDELPPLSSYANHSNKEIPQSPLKENHITTESEYEQSEKESFEEKRDYQLRKRKRISYAIEYNDEQEEEKEEENKSEQSTHTIHRKDIYPTAAKFVAQCPLCEQYFESVTKTRTQKSLQNHCTTIHKKNISGDEHIIEPTLLYDFVAQCPECSFKIKEEKKFINRRYTIHDALKKHIAKKHKKNTDNLYDSIQEIALQAAAASAIPKTVLPSSRPAAQLRLPSQSASSGLQHAQQDKVASNSESDSLDNEPSQLTNQFTIRCPHCNNSQQFKLVSDQETEKQMANVALIKQLQAKLHKIESMCK